MVRGMYRLGYSSYLVRRRGRVVLGQWNLGPSLPKLAVGLEEERIILSRQGSPLGQDWKVVSLLVL